MKDSSGACDVLPALVALNGRGRSWREKLDGLRGLILDSGSLTLENLVDVAIYLRFIGTGQVPCEEDGRHFRPVHHARIASDIHERLAGMSSSGNAFVLRKIYPCLPSFAEPFQRAEPLTRIRDIAHRNDIPSELKREIKHTLQNKLHRCAGPEDLATSAALLERITAPDTHYSHDFVEQFRIFHGELREFFNARSLEDRLNALQRSVDGESAGLIQSFLSAKQADGEGADGECLRVLTGLRWRLREEAVDRSVVDACEVLLADVALEDFAFVLLSNRINALETEPPDATLAAWVEVCRLATANLRLSDVEPGECEAVESELCAWGELVERADRDALLRLKAATERVRRLAESFSDRLFTLFSERVAVVGRAFGVEERQIAVLGEAEIRSHVVFQLAKAVSAMLRQLRERLELSGWDPLVCGRAAGRLCAVPTLRDLEPVEEPVIVLLRKAEGDEEIPAGVGGVLLAHELPHLSHLGVRARQAGVVFAACEDPHAFAELESLVGTRMEVETAPDSVRWGPATSVVPVTGRKGAVVVPDVDVEDQRVWLPLEHVSLESGGSKANAARRLAERAARADAEFKAPTGLVIPFGALHAALRSPKSLRARYERLLTQFETSDSLARPGVVDQIAELLVGLPVPGEIEDAVLEQFGAGCRLMVRSSANCEDLEQLSGAGLYESVANVTPSTLAQAVKTVWASLWTQRAAFSRAQSGVPHAKAHMAVLIQPMMAADLSFILHTVNPVNSDPRELYAEIAVGMGETLASASAPGTPWRFVCNKDTGDVCMLAFANFSHALRPELNGGGGLHNVVVDYSRARLTCDVAARQQWAQRLVAVAHQVEAAFGEAQDIEGAIVGEDIHLVQTRPQF